MSVRRARRPYTRRARRGLRTTALAVAAMAALTASQAPGLTGDDQDIHAGPAADDLDPAPPGGPFAALAPPGDGSYHTELPPLAARNGTPALSPVLGSEVRAQSGIPATVLRAYRAAEAAVGRTDPGCRLPWELLAAIGKVESGQARGGAVDRTGTTLGRITGPPLNGRGFALIRDSDGGVHDGDTVYDRAVGPMQFLPSTWARWGADGNRDGRADPNNVFDAALAAGHYLCAGDRDLGRAADLDRAVLSYNNSRAYVELVRYWLEFYRRGVHTVPDGKGVVPKSPGAGGDTPATEPVDGGGKDPAGREDGVDIGPDPTTTPSGSAPSPSRPVPTRSPGPSTPTAPPTSQEPSEPPTQPPTDPPTESPTGSPSPDPTDPGPSPSPTDDCSPEPGTPSPDPTASSDGAACPSPSPTATE
ncbi:lytic murein transglycosylase [Streptomyces sp. BPPL-273]|uniref:lytic transglycosylase domain-containing protein n=1 Tax=Streptomyces TaxID=1883 RepID=UPI0024AED2C3|nr:MULTISPECIES: lytic murein transglycosylase [unclassified Streptomyces]WHM33156.1 lytic murein transglycosylase [Streptomyces sp. BPPL-273]WML80214.1 lytic murein transglycosylase [Streptomyces sp. VNUA74]